MAIIRRFIRGNDGTTAIEYSLIAALFSLGCIAGWSAVSDEIIQLFEIIAGAFGV